MKKELQSASLFITRNKNELIVTTFATLFLTLENYHPIYNGWANSLFYYLALPLIVTVFLLRKTLRESGLGPGNVRVWGSHVLVSCLVLLPVLFAASRIPAFQSFYKMEDFNFGRYFLENSAYLLGWEFIFRGFLLFGLKGKLKEGSILVQMVPFVLLHFGKPELETLSTIITGIYFGYVAYRGNSYWPAFIIHLFINVFFISVVNLMN